ncbi:ATP-binding cassette sub-family D member-like [Teleopsis dalmanni]|nr:ATP-binding cassette sub-family D member-like [Teleopsis dalmanni]
MAVFSKFLDRIITKNDNAVLMKIAFSQAVVGLAICAYAVKLTNPLFVSDSKSDASTTKELINNINDEEFKLAEAEKLIIEKELKKSKRKHNTEPSLNKEFTQQLAKLIRIMVPRLFCYETGLLTVHTFCLISRTFLSIFVASLEGEIVKFIVRKDIKQFAIVLVKWFGIAIPATFINSMIRFLESKLALSFRTRLVKHSYQLYFKNQNYYRVSNLDGRVENADHR